MSEKTVQTIGTHETKFGTLIYTVTGAGAGFKGKVTHDLHKHPRMAGKKSGRYSKYYKTQRGAANWAKGELALQGA